MVTATSQMKELGEHLKQLEVLNKQSIEKETDAIKQSTYWKERYQGIKEELDKTQGMCEAKDFSKYKKKHTIIQNLYYQGKKHLKQTMCNY